MEDSEQNKESKATRQHNWLYFRTGMLSWCRPGRSTMKRKRKKWIWEVCSEMTPGTTDNFRLL